MSVGCARGDQLRVAMFPVSLLGALSLATLPPLRLGTGDAHGDVGVALQLRTTTLSDFDSAPRSDLEIRRLRFSLRGEALERRVRFAFQLNATPRALELLDAWVEWRPSDWMSLRAGQAKIPLTRHRQQRFSELAFTDWAVAVFQFGAERQVGLSTRIGGDASTWRFDGGLFNGQNARATFERGLAEAWGEQLPNPSILFAPPPPLAFHPEWVGRLSWSSQPMVSERSVDAAGGPLRVVGSIGAAWDQAPSRRREYRGRVAPEILVQVDHWSLDLGGYLGWAHLEGSEVALASIGVNAEVARWVAPGFLFGLRWSSVSRSPALLSYVQSVTGDRAVPALHELTGVVALPLGDELLRLQVEAAWVHEASDALRARAQLQLAW